MAAHDRHLSHDQMGTMLRSSGVTNLVQTQPGRTPRAHRTANGTYYPAPKWLPEWGGLNSKSWECSTCTRPKRVRTPRCILCVFMSVCMNCFPRMVLYGLQTSIHIYIWVCIYIWVPFDARPLLLMEAGQPCAITMCTHC